MVSEYELADKTIGHHHIHFAAKHGIALEHSDKIHLATLEQLKGLLHRVGAFDVFRAHIEQTNARTPFLGYSAGKARRRRSRHRTNRLAVQSASAPKFEHQRHVIACPGAEIWQWPAAECREWF